MRRTARLLTGTVLAVIAAGPAAAPAYGTVPGADTDGGAGKVTVYPSGVVPGAEVTVGTGACGPDGTATGDASAVGAGTFGLAPRAHGEHAIGRFTVPPGAQPGTYEIVVRCAGGDRDTTGEAADVEGAEEVKATGDLVVTLTPGHAQVHPRGSVKTGVGGALGPDPVQTAAGVAALAVAAAGGTWLLHRRARGDGI
ncbi:hypothetical protein [Streptomyces poonensis]|uniref:Sortase n=1 Tax=Streptomyces poonensis TaxID=68255 RepID=A0A918PQS5_9ACTN|nr:hypothetical protein [Streptomyces poonensis]GGZ19216.1 hypothetical protein GCM10010365_44530 [Streptomyces poonensis]GLJ90713.1 hypothetical protein GCM10017589_33180 [Streptomyces poonensis]